MEKQKRNRVRRKANPLIYYPFFVVIWLYYALMNRITRRTEATKQIKGPAIVLSTHPNFFDFAHVAIALFPHRITVVTNRMYCEMDSLSGLLKRFRAIPKRLFYADTETVYRLFESVRNGHIVVMMPEGRLSNCGRNFPVATGTAKLIKRMGVPVYRAHAEGAYFLKPKWGKGKRRGNIRLETELLLDREAVARLPEAEIGRLLDEKMAYLEERALGELTYCKDRTKGLDGLLFVCPECGREYTLHTERDCVICDACGFSAYMKKDCTFTGGRIRYLYEWYDIQLAHVRAQAESLRLSSPVRVTRMLKRPGKFRDVGTGLLTLDRSALTYRGSLLGKETAFEIPLDTLDGLPFNCGSCINCYYQNEQYFFYLQVNPRQCVQWSMLVDVLAERRRESAAQ